MKITTIIGARPQFIKAKMISLAIKKCSIGANGIKEVLINTGQHYDYNMAGQFFDGFLDFQPEYNLGIGSHSREKQIFVMVRKIKEVFQIEKPDVVIVYGDTNSTLAGARAANSLKIKVAHIEAGLRSYDMNMPEEVNRLETDKLSHYLFCPTGTAKTHLLKERIKGKMYVVGDVMYDVLKSSKKQYAKSNVLDKVGLKKKQYFLATIHRQSNTNIKANLENIVKILTSVNDHVVFPVHPRTYKYLKKYEFLGDLKNSNVVMIEPVGYFDMICLERNARKIITDSGGVQKEAYMLGVPCVTLRDTTEWTETLEDGANVLTGTSIKKTLKAISSDRTVIKRKYPYGKGNAAEKIIKILWKEVTK